MTSFPCCAAISSNSRQAPAAASTSPFASMISTYAGSSATRGSPRDDSAIALRIVAAAESELALREPQEGQAGLRLAAEATRPAIGLFRKCELAPETAHLALAVGGVADWPVGSGHPV